MIHLTKLSVATDRLSIRPLVSADYDTWLYSYERCLPVQNEFDHQPPKLDRCTREWFSKRCDRHQRRALRDELYYFGIFHTETKTYIGHVELATIRRHDMQWANVGYGILNQFWKNGYAKEALEAVIRLGFNELGYNRIEAAMEVSNFPSIVLVERLNMLREGLRHNFVYEDDRWKDFVVYAANPVDFGLEMKPPRKAAAIVSQDLKPKEVG